MRNYYVLKNLCRYIYLAGSGNFWYEDGEIGDDNNLSYKLYAFILFFIYIVTTILEIMASVIGDFPEDEKSDSVTFAVSHTIVMIKIFSVIYHKDMVKSLNNKIVRVCEEYEDPELMKQKYRIMKLNVIAYSVTVYGCFAGFVLEGLRKLKEGSHFGTIVTYWPTYEDNSLFSTLCRIFSTVVLFVMMLTMISIDGGVMVYLVMYKYKFITLRHYFENLKVEFDKTDKTENIKRAADQLTKGFVNGIKMHADLLSLSKEIDQSFGTVMALQVCQSSGSAVSLLLQIALSNTLTIVAIIKIILFVVGLFFLLALFLCNAGEITYQASLLSDSIFYCGWYACPPQPPPQCNLRRLVLFACAQAQRPLVMKAFKMLELTYGTFLLVVRGTYSVFALFYAQNE